MTRDEIKEKVFESIADVAGFSSTDNISETDLFEDDLGFDSLDCVEAIMQIEDKFNLSIPDEAAENMMAVGDIIHAVHNMIGD